MYQTIFLRENEKDILQALKKQGIKTEAFEHHLADLFNRVYNNFVGYYLFAQDGIVYKIIVLPKTIRPSDNAEKDFVDYLLDYYRINNLYKFDTTKKIPNSLLQLAFEANNSDTQTHDFLSEFQSHRYTAIIQSIEGFFKRHNNSKRIEVDHISQSIKHKLNLERNTKELDKSKIHQTQKRDIAFSMLATVTYGALKLFVTQKYSGLDEKYKSELFREIKKLQTMLLKKYKIESGYKLSLASLQSIKLTRLFAKTQESQDLLIDIKSLFGFAQMYRDNTLSVNFREDMTTHSLFINPNHFYEWYVYDILKNFAIQRGYQLLFDKAKNFNTSIGYNLISREHRSDKGRCSNPDYILVDDENQIKIVLDAKWKNITKLGDIQSSDFLKLQHDAKLLESDGYKTIPYLIYPTYLGNEDSITISKDDSYFNFGILEISMNFDETQNSIDFRFDYQKIEEEIEKEKQEKILLVASQYIIGKIDSDRREAIEELLNRSDIGEREEIFCQLDEQLLVYAEEINKNIEEIISPEIQSLLDNFDDILEEDSKKFLKSSSSIYNHYKKKNYEHFDYSMPGSGLWKLIELELNTSFSWFLRIKSNVCNNICPWTNISNSRRSITQDLENRKQVRLNQFEHNNSGKLQGIMLGGISLLLQDNSTVEEFNEIDTLDRHFFVSQLIEFLSEVINLRNEHAHIKAMSLEKFEELYNLLFGDEEKIRELLGMKKAIKQHIKGLSQC